MAAGVVTITSAVLVWGRDLRGRTVAVERFYRCGRGVWAVVALPPEFVEYGLSRVHVDELHWTRVA